MAGLELRLKKDQFDREQKEKRAQADRSHNYAQEIDGIKLSIEERRIAAELERLGFQNTSSGIDSYISISRFVNEKQDAEVKILQSFSDRLLGDTAKERLYALLIISAYVSPEVIKRLAAGGEEIIPTESLKILEKTEDYEIRGCKRHYQSAVNSSESNLIDGKILSGTMFTAIELCRVR